MTPGYSAAPISRRAYYFSDADVLG